MLKNFEIVMDLLELDVDRKKYMEIATFCEKNKDKVFFFFHRHAFLFVAFLELLREEISLEFFMATWDVGSKDKLISFSGADSFSASLSDSDFLEDLGWSYVVLDNGMLSSFWDLDQKSKKYSFSYLSC